MVVTRDLMKSYTNIKVNRVFHHKGKELQEIIYENINESGMNRLAVCFNPYTSILVDGKLNEMFAEDYNPSSDLTAEEDTLLKVLAKFDKHHKLGE